MLTILLLYLSYKDFAMEVICLEDKAFYTLIEEVVNRIKEKQESRKISGFQVKKQC